MQLEESKMLAAESSKLSATAMYERMLLQQALAPCDDSNSVVKKEKSEKARPARHKSRKRPSAQSSSSSATAAAAASSNKSLSSSTSSSVSVATLASSVPDIVLGSIASNVHAHGSALESQLVELGAGIDAMRAADMNVVFRDATHASVLDRIRTMGKVNVRPINIWPRGLARLQSHRDASSPSSRNSTKRKKAPVKTAGNSSSSSSSSSNSQRRFDGVASSDSAESSGPSRKRRRRDRQSDSTA
jgi:hypothetical protein